MSGGIKSGFTFFFALEQFILTNNLVKDFVVSNVSEFLCSMQARSSTVGLI